MRVLDLEAMNQVKPEGGRWQEPPSADMRAHAIVTRSAAPPSSWSPWPALLRLVCSRSPGVLLCLGRFVQTIAAPILWHRCPYGSHLQRALEAPRKEREQQLQKEAEEALLLAQYLRRKQAERALLEEREAKRLKDYLDRRG